MPCHAWVAVILFTNNSHNNNDGNKSEDVSIIISMYLYSLNLNGCSCFCCCFCRCRCFPWRWWWWWWQCGMRPFCHQFTSNKLCLSHFFFWLLLLHRMKTFIVKVVILWMREGFHGACEWSVVWLTVRARQLRLEAGPSKEIKTIFTSTYVNISWVGDELNDYLVVIFPLFSGQILLFCRARTKEKLLNFKSNFEENNV